MLKMTSIKPLPRAVHSTLRSSVILFDLSRVVEELIYNSIDAGALKVNTAISIGDCYVKVEDDGYGITRDGLVLLGGKYATSKLHCIAEMDVVSENFGFRGEALGSLSDVSLLEVTTKARGRPNGYRKIIKGCKCLHLGIDDNRQEMGTTVVVRDLFYNQPVRRKCMQSSPKKVLHSVKKCVLRVALVYPQVSFKVTDVESGDEILCTRSSPSPLPLVTSEFGTDVSCSLCELNFSRGIWKLSGYISGAVESCSMKALQYVYINSRFVCKGPIHKLLNNLAESIKCLETWKGAPGFRNDRRSKIQVNTAYILNLHCPRSSYDLNFEPSKTMVEFKDWIPVLTFIEQAIRQFWTQMLPEGEPHVKFDEASGEGAVWKNGDEALIPVQDVFTEDLFVNPEITKKKRRLQHDQSFLPPSFSLEIASEESDHLLHPKKHMTPSEALDRNSKKVKVQETNDYFHLIDYTSQGMSPTSSNTFNSKATPIISREHCVQVWTPDSSPFAVEDYILSNDLTERQTNDDDVNDNIFGSRWDNDFLEADAVVNERLTETLTPSYYDNKTDISFSPRCPKKPFLRSCSLLGNGSSRGNVIADHQGFDIGADEKYGAQAKQRTLLGYGSSPGNVIADHQGFDIEADEKFGAQAKQRTPDEMIIANDSDRSLDLSPKNLSPDMFATSSRSSSILTCHHTMTDLNVLSTNLIKCYPTDEIRYTEESTLFDNSPEQVEKRGSNLLSTSSGWSVVSPHPISSTVASKIDHFTDEYAPIKNYISCRSTSSRIFRDRHTKGELLSYANLLDSSNEEGPSSSCTDIDVDYECAGRYNSRSPSPGRQSNDFLIQRVGFCNRPDGEMDWLSLDSSNMDKENNFVTPIVHNSSPFCQENRNPSEELNFQCHRQFLFRKGRSRRSHSAPPFYKGKEKFSTIYNCLTTAAEREPSSPKLQVTSDFKHSSNLSAVSPHHIEQNRTKDYLQHSRIPVATVQGDTKYTDHIQEGYTSSEVLGQEISAIKWRNGNQQTAVEQDRDDSNYSPQQNGVLDVISGFLHLAGGSVVPESISKDCLEDAKVLLQLDKKFIPVVAGATLVVIDQHAADERIRLEELRHKVLSGEGKSVTYLDSEQELVLPEIGYQLLQNYAEQIQSWGWICNVHAQVSGSFIKNISLLHRRTSIITLLAVPCILGVNLSGKDLVEFLEQLAETDGSSTLPPSVIRVLNYKACRGAIMFGDALLPSECSLIIEELKQTSLCFQCAHGRPTTAPLVNLEALHKQIANLNNWNGGSDEPWHGLNKHRPTLERARQRLLSAGQYG